MHNKQKEIQNKQRYMMNKQNSVKYVFIERHTFRTNRDTGKPNRSTVV